MKPILDGMGLKRTVIRLSHEIEERSEGLEGVVLVGVKASGGIVARRIRDYFKKNTGIDVPCAEIDIDVAGERTIQNELPFSVMGKKVILCADVLYTGRSAVAAIEEIFALGRPKKIQLLVLVDRGGRELPVRADYVGRNVPTSHTEYVVVSMKELGDDQDLLAIVQKGKNK